LLLILAAGFHFGRDNQKPPIMANPGPLSSKHASFVTNGCASCHANHNQGLGGLFKATFTHGSMNTQCSACHSFAGPAHVAHNDTRPERLASPSTDCRQCHTEHKGAFANLTTIQDSQCHTCHKVKFQRFEKGHPEFAETFPREERGSIKFNHAKHLLDYFKQPNHTANAPQNCVSCHAVSTSDKNVRTVGFDSACATCHAEQIPQNELVLLRLPDAVTNAATITTDDATPFMAWVLQRGGSTNYGVALQTLLGAGATDGVTALATILADSKNNRTEGLFAGLSHELIARPAQQWLKQQRFEPVAAKTSSGWYWMEDLYPELRYKPTGHGDMVAGRWTHLALNVSNGALDENSKRRAAAFETETAGLRSGVGRCVKCHAVSVTENSLREIAWRQNPIPERAHTKFSHGAHLNVANCTDCHSLNVEANYEGQFSDFTTTKATSNFKSMRLANCTSCHAQNKVRNDCALCHQYHQHKTTITSAQPR
jgi:hypothetical protein